MKSEEFGVWVALDVSQRYTFLRMNTILVVKLKLRLSVTIVSAANRSRVSNLNFTNDMLV